MLKCIRWLHTTNGLTDRTQISVPRGAHFLLRTIGMETIEPPRTLCPPRAIVQVKLHCSSLGIGAAAAAAAETRYDAKP
jgi:hypothetical protein